MVEKNSLNAYKPPLDEQVPDITLKDRAGDELSSLYGTAIELQSSDSLQARDRIPVAVESVFVVYSGECLFSATELLKQRR